jgi:hypothetical protein
MGVIAGKQTGLAWPIAEQQRNEYGKQNHS